MSMRRIGVCLAAALLAGCSTLPSPSSIPSGTATATTAPSATQGRPGSLTFRLTLTAITASTESFGLYLQTDPASVGQTGFLFCGPGLDDPKSCTVLGSFERSFSGFDPGTVLTYRFEHFPNVGSTAVIASGTHLADGSVIELTYPAS